MFCKNCGKELPDSAKFCSGCGTPVAPEATAPGAEPPQPPVEETPVSPVPPAEETPAPPVEEPTAPAVPVQPAAPQGEERVPVPVTKRRGVSGMVVIGLGAVAAIVVIVLLVKLFSGMGGGKRSQAFAYVNDDAELMYLADLKEKTEPIEVTDEADSSA